MMGNVGYIEELQRIVPGLCIECKTRQGHTDVCRLNRLATFRLVIDPPLRPDMDGWGHIGNIVISYSIIHVWRINEFIEPASIEIGNLWALTERGQLAAARRLKDNEIILPDVPAPYAIMSDVEMDAPVEGLLFTRGGTCTLCHAKMDVFGQISHAKKHVNQGYSVMIEEINGKKVAKITDAAPTPQPGSGAEYKTGPGETDIWIGQELFSAPDSTGRSRCRLCTDGPPVHKFGQISHTKMHIARKDPVKIQTIGGKGTPIVDVVESINQTPTVTHVDPEREAGIDAILALRRAAGLPEDREEAGVNWDNMGPVTRMQTVRTAKAIDKI